MTGFHWKTALTWVVLWFGVAATAYAVGLGVLAALSAPGLLLIGSRRIQFSRFAVRRAGRIP